jgi:uncharacterized protein YjdB
MKDSIIVPLAKRLLTSRRARFAWATLLLTAGVALAQPASASDELLSTHAQLGASAVPRTAAPRSAAPFDCVGQVVYVAQVQGLGRLPSACDGGVAGTTGESRRLEALQLVVGWQNVCLNGHVQTLGDQGWNCADLANGQPAKAGTTGQGLRLEGVHIRTWGGPTLCAQAYLQDTGWQQEQCGADIWVGTSGKGIRMEAFRAWRHT